MPSDKTILAFGSMLHDVGKIVYRGSSAKGTHSKLGADFISDEIGSQNKEFEGEAGDKIIEQIRYHHAQEIAKSSNLADDSLAFITYFADNISAGMDRKNEGDETQGATFDRAAKLRKIFNIVNGRNDDNTLEHEDYNSIRERIKRNLLNTKITSQEINSMLNLLEATTDKIPSSTNLSELIDVSLFDHAKTTAALSACMYDYLVNNGIKNYRDALFDQKSSPRFYELPMFLLYSCDMSGIQSFIYNISGSGALKQLRARSLYLELLLEHVVDELLRLLELSRANLLYTGGGHAYLLLPNTENSIETISNFNKELQEWFLDTYRTDLYMASAWEECSPNDLMNKGEDKQRYSNIYRSLAQKISEKKASRYSASTILGLNKARPQGIERSHECSECHRSDEPLVDEHGKKRCSLCAALSEISKDFIRKDVFIVIEEDPEQEASLKNKSIALPFGKRLLMYSREEYERKNVPVTRVYTKNEWDMGKELSTHIWMGDYSAETYGAGISSYASTSATLDVDLGIKRLGVLRADADDLGSMFVQGLPEEKISISRTATLSRSLSYFFKVKINEILHAGEYRAQIIYSGGDDLFLIGNWSDVIHAAIDIRKALAEFTGNDVLTMSAGVGMFSPKYPIARMASEAGSLEAEAKLYARHAGVNTENSKEAECRVTKNAVALWSKENTFGWEEFVEGVYPRLLEIKDMFEGNKKGKAFIYRLILLLRSFSETISAPRLAYLLARSFEDDKQQGEAFSKKIYEWAQDEQERACLITALEWYVYSIREEG